MKTVLLSSDEFIRAIDDISHVQPSNYMLDVKASGYVLYPTDASTAAHLLTERFSVLLEEVEANSLIGVKFHDSKQLHLMIRDEVVAIRSSSRTLYVSSNGITNGYLELEIDNSLNDTTDGETEIEFSDEELNRALEGLGGEHGVNENIVDTVNVAHSVLCSILRNNSITSRITGHYAGSGNEILRIVQVSFTVADAFVKEANKRVTNNDTTD